MYEALRTVAACYLRSDKEGIIDTLTAYNATEALYDVAAAEAAFLHSHCMAELRAEVAAAEARGNPPLPPNSRYLGVSARGLQEKVGEILLSSFQLRNGMAAF